MVSRAQNKRIKDFTESLELLDGDKLKNYVLKEKQWLHTESPYKTEGGIGTVTSLYLKAISESELSDSKKEIARNAMNLSKDEWQSRNASQEEKSDKQARNQVELYPSRLIDRALELIDSDKPTILGAVLLFVSGRRPSELIKTAKFEKVDNVYLRFSGQLKTKGNNLRPYEIPCLINTDKFLKAFHRFRKMDKIVELSSLEDVKDIDSRFNSSLRYQVKQSFSFLKPPYGQAQLSCSNLRSAYATIATHLYRPKNVASIIYYGDILGHSRPKELDTDKDARKKYATTISYFDYEVASDSLEKVESVDKKEFDMAKMSQQLIEYWDFSDEEKEMVNSLADEKQMSLLELTKTTLLIEAKRRWSLNQKSLDASKIDSEALKPSEGKGASRFKGVTEIKLNRALEAIIKWNDEQETIEKKWAITVNGLKRLTGTKHETISNFIKDNLKTIQKHHQKHEIDEKRQNTFRGKQGDKIEDDVKW